MLRSSPKADDAIEVSEKKLKTDTAIIQNIPFLDIAEIYAELLTKLEWVDLFSLAETCEIARRNLVAEMFTKSRRSKLGTLSLLLPDAISRFDTEQAYQLVLDCCQLREKILHPQLGGTTDIGFLIFLEFINDRYAQDRYFGVLRELFVDVLCREIHNIDAEVAIQFLDACYTHPLFAKPRNEAGYAAKGFLYGMFSQNAKSTTTAQDKIAKERDVINLKIESMRTSPHLLMRLN